MNFHYSDVVVILPSASARSGPLFFWRDPPLDLSHCQELQEIGIRTTDPLESDVALISSITSINLQKITFVGTLWKRPRSNPFWPYFDDLVCGLFDKLCLLGYQSILEVDVFLLDWMGPLPQEFVQQFLPKFRKKGRVNIFEGPSVQSVLLP